MKDLLEKERKEHKQRFTRDAAAELTPITQPLIQVAEKVNIKGARCKNPKVARREVYVFIISEDENLINAPGESNVKSKRP